MKKIIGNSFILTILNIIFMMILIDINSGQETGSILHQMIVFFSILLFFANIIITFLTQRFNDFFLFLSGYNTFFVSLVIYIISLVLSKKVNTSNDLLINFMFISSFFLSLTTFFIVKKKCIR